MSYKFEYGCAKRYLDVSQIVYDNFLKDGVIAISGISYNHFFTDPVFGEVKHLKVSAIDGSMSPVYIKEDSSFSMKASPQSLSSPVNIVYYINTLNKSKYYYTMEAQLIELVQSGLLELPNVVFYAVVTAAVEYHSLIEAQVKSIISGAVLTFNTENLFEYPGIKRVWDLAQESLEGITLYFHSKGITWISNPSKGNCRTSLERQIFGRVINEWKRNLQILQQFDSVNKLGIGSGGIGWVWYNFWFAKNRYLHFCEDPIITTRRHYYEDWLGRYKPSNLIFGTGTHRSNEERDMTCYNVLPFDCYNIGYNLGIGDCNIGSLINPSTVDSYVWQPFISK